MDKDISITGQLDDILVYLISMLDIGTEDNHLTFLILHPVTVGASRVVMLDCFY